MKKWTASILALIVVVLFSCGFEICEYFYEHDIDNWKILRGRLEAIVYVSMFFIYKLPRTEISESSINSFFVFAAGDFVDRWWFNIREFTLSDIVIIVMAIVVFTCSLIYYTKHDTKFRE